MATHAEADTSEKLLEIVKEYKGDLVILLDLVMPEKGGIWAVNAIKEIAPNTEIVVLSGKTDKATVMSVIQLGALGFVSKEADTKEILEALRAAAKKERYLSKDISVHLLDAIEEDIKKGDKFKALSRRELQTMALAGEGYSISAISEILGLSVKTVSTYKSRIYTKLGISNSNELIKFTIDNNISYEDFIDVDDLEEEKKEVSKEELLKKDAEKRKRIMEKSLGTHGNRKENRPEKNEESDPVKQNERKLEKA